MDYSTIDKLLKDVSREELIKIITRLVSFDTDSEEVLLDYCKQKGDGSSKSLIVKKQIQHYWNEAEKIISEANEYGGTYNEDDAYDALYMIDTLCDEIELDWKFKQPIVDEMLEQFYIGNSGFDDTLIDSCMMLCSRKDEKLYLAAALSKGGDYYAGVAAKMYLDYGEEEKYLRVRQNNLCYGSDYIELANYFLRKNQYNKAVELVEKALECADGRMDEVYEWLFKKYAKKKQEDKIIGLYYRAIQKKWDIDVMVQLMYQYYEDDYTEKKKYLLKIIEVCDTSSLGKWFNECKKVLSENDFQEQSNYLYATFKKRNLQDYLRLRIEEGHLQEVLAKLQESSITGYGYSLDSSHELSGKLAEVYPLEICERYWKECESLCSQSNKKNYMRAVVILKEIKMIMLKHQFSGKWNIKYTEFLERHSRKSLLIGYLKSGQML